MTDNRTMEEELFVCAIKDVFSNKIVGHLIDSRTRTRIAFNSLNNIVARCGQIRRAD